MTEQVNRIFEAASKLTVEERVELIERLRASMSKVDAGIEQAWLQEALDRLVAYERGEMESHDAEDVVAELRRK